MVQQDNAKIEAVNKFLPLNMRDTFDDLIDRYYERNAKGLIGYRSSWEQYHEDDAWILDRTASERVVPVSEKEKVIWQLGKVKPTITALLKAGG